MIEATLLLSLGKFLASDCMVSSVCGNKSYFSFGSGTHFL